MDKDAHGVRLGQDSAMGRDRIELALIAALIVVVAALAVMTVWPWVVR